MNKLTDLEALECIVVDLVPKAKEHNKEEIEQIKKSLEVLEIIKKKEVNIGLIKNCYGAFAYAIYNSHIDKEKNYKLTKEEFDLVKEWLSNDK